MSAPHDELWKRALTAIEARGALAPGSLTAREIAAAADRHLGSDLVRRLVEGYYQPRRYGGAPILTDDEAEALVSTLEALPAASTGAPSMRPAAAAGRVTTESAAPADGSFEGREAQPVGLEDPTSAAVTHHASRNDAVAGDIPLALKQEPDSADAWRKLGEAQREAGALEAAVESLEMSRALDPTIAGTHNVIGVCYVQLGKPEKALDAYREATRLNPEPAIPWYNLGSCCEDLNLYTEAEAALRRYTSVQRDDADGWAALGRCLYYLNRDAEALGVLQTALVWKPKHANGWAWVGWVKSRLQDWPGAAEAFRKALDINPASVRVRDDLAAALTKAGRPQEAKKALAAAPRKSKPAKPERGGSGRGGWVWRALILTAAVIAVAAVGFAAIHLADSIS